MTVDEIRGAVMAWAPPERLIRRIYLFGSRARGTARPDSDVDLLVLHGIDPLVRPTCDPETAHHFTWSDHNDRWRTKLGSLLKLPVDLQTLGRPDHGLRSYAKSCRVLLYRRAALEAAGIKFIAENGGGAGVRSKAPEPIIPTDAEECSDGR